MAALIRFWTSVLIAAAAAIVFALSACFGTGVEVDVARADLEAAAARRC